MYRPNEAKVRNLKTKDYLGKARLVAASDRSNAFTGFAGSEIKNVSCLSPNDAIWLLIPASRPKRKQRTTAQPRTCLSRLPTWSSLAFSPGDNSLSPRPTGTTRSLPLLLPRTIARVGVLPCEALDRGRTSRPLASRRRRAVEDMRRQHLHKTDRSTDDQPPLLPREVSPRESPHEDRGLSKRNHPMVMKYMICMVKAREEASSLGLGSSDMKRTMTARIMTTAPLTRANSRWYRASDAAPDRCPDPAQHRADPTFARSASRFTQMT